MARGRTQVCLTQVWRTRDSKPRARRRLDSRLELLPALLEDDDEDAEAAVWSRLTLLEAKAGAPVSPARMSPPRPLDFRRRRVPSASRLCNCSAGLLSSGNGSDMVSVYVCELCVVRLQHLVPVLMSSFFVRRGCSRWNREGVSVWCGKFRQSRFDRERAKERGSRVGGVLPLFFSLQRRLNLRRRG